MKGHPKLLVDDRVRQSFDRLTEIVKEFILVREIIQADIDRARLKTVGVQLDHLKNLQELSEAQSYSRLTVISTVALFEALTHQLFFLIDNVDDVILVRLLPSEYYHALKGLSPRIDKNGEPTLVKIKPNFFQRLEFSYKCFSKLFGLPVELDKGSGGWSKFKSTIEVRNRIVHPKTVDCLSLTDREISDLNSSHVWFSQMYNDIMTEFHKRAEPWMYWATAAIYKPSTSSYSSDPYEFTINFNE